MKRILFYYPPNKRTVAIETIVEELKKENNTVFFLTLTPWGQLHDVLKESGIEVFSISIEKKNKLLYYFRHITYLINFCKQKKIDFIFSNLQEANFIAVFAQFFIKARVVVFRHHFHAIVKVKGLTSINRNERIMEKFICKLAKEIIVPSSEVYNGMIKYESVRKNKIKIIPYIYNFSKYPKINKDEVNRIRDIYKTKLLIITASRMTSFKRHDLILPVYSRLIKRGYDIKVLLMDDGEKRNELEKYVSENNLIKNIFFLGFKTELVNYLAASDLLVHPSFTEASSSIVKEFGILNKPVIVCDGVGDFSEYIKHNENGYLVKPGNEDIQFEKYILDVYENPKKALKLGENLYHTIMNRFIPKSETLFLYKKLLNQNSCL